MSGLLDTSVVVRYLTGDPPARAAIAARIIDGEEDLVLTSVVLVDWILEGEKRWLAVEVKWSDAPGDRDARHLGTFLSEYPKASEGIVVCRTPRRFKLAAGITAVPWHEIPTLAERLR